MIMTILILALCASPFFLYKGFSDPSFFVLIFIMFSLCRIQEWIPQLYPYQMPMIFLSLAVIILSISVVLRKTEIYWCKELSYFSAFFIWVSLSMLFSYNLSVSFDFWSKTFLKIGVGFFIITWAINEKKDYLWFLFICISCGVIISLITLYNKYHGIGLVEGTRASLTLQSGVITDPNDLALLLIVFYSFALTLFISKFLPLIIRFLGLSASLIIADAIIATQSRGGLLGLTGVSVCFFYQRVKSKTIIIIFGILLLIFLYYVGGIGQRESGGSLGFEEGLDDSSFYRVEAWKAAIKMAIFHPLFGVGFGNFSDNFFMYTGGMVKHNMVAHSTWLSVLSETGFVGFALFISCVYLSFKSINLTIKHIENNNDLNNKGFLLAAYSIYFGLVGFCISGTFLDQGYSWIFYILFALSVSLSHNFSKVDKIRRVFADSPAL